jgi:S-adenosylmethionine uptake transporter
MPSTNNVKGIGLMVLGFCFFALGDALAKLLTDSLPSLQIVWFRTLGLFIGVCVLIGTRGFSILKSSRPVLQVLRGLGAVGSATCFIIAIRYVPLADAVAVTFVAPFIVTALGAFLLKEPVGPRRWMAIVIGFIGMLIVIRPGQGVVHPAIFLVVAAATFFAFRQLLSRWLSGADSVVTTVAYTSILTFSITGIAQLFVWVTPTGLDVILLIIGLALCGATGEILIIRALDIAQSVALAPCHYTLIIWGTLYGYLFFGELPDRWALTGCIIIMASGLYTMYRERLLARAAAQATKQAPTIVPDVVSR